MRSAPNDQDDVTKLPTAMYREQDNRPPDLVEQMRLAETEALRSARVLKMIRERMAIADAEHDKRVRALLTGTSE